MTIPIAVVTGVAVMLAGSLPWLLLGPANGLGSTTLPAGAAVPWAVLPMGLYLWAYWRFIGGAWGDEDSRKDRRTNLRANTVPSGLWLPSLGAGLLGFATLLALLALASRLVELPAGVPITTPPQMPVVTVVVLLAMQSIIAGVTEEAAFRGYMQSMIERAYGIVIAILVNGLLFGLLHFPSHPGDVVLMLPYYIAVAAVYGGLTWAVDSILPALVLHTAGDVVVLTRWWATGLPEWQMTATPSPLVWSSGVDTQFIAATLLSMTLTAATFFVYRTLRKNRA